MATTITVVAIYKIVTYNKKDQQKAEVQIMSGKYMKIKKIFIPTMTLIIMASQLFGCSAASQDETLQMLNNSEGIEIEVATPDTETDEPTEEDQQAISQLDWTELGLLETNPNLREAFEKIFKVTGTTGNKEGIIYETPTSSTDTTYTYDNNNTLSVALHNYNFRSLYDSKSTEIADTARSNYLDLDEEDDSVCIAVAINTYFNLLPDTNNGDSNPNETLTRAQAMAAIMRATTPVDDSLQIDTAFSSAVGDTEYNLYAQSLNDSAFLNTTDGSLDSTSYTGKMTRGEAIYLLMNKFFHDDIDGASAKYPGLTFDDCIDGGTYTGNTADALKQMLDESTTNKVDSRIYNAMVLAQFYGIINAGESNWDAAITKSEFINLLVGTLYNETTTMERFNVPDGVVDVTDAESMDAMLSGEYIKPEGTVNGYENPELVPQPSDYGKSIQTPDDLPSISGYGWDYEKHPLYFGYTKLGFKIVQDGLTGNIFYPGMVTPDGQSFGGDKEYIALNKIREKYGYDYACQITLEQAQEYFGEPDLSTMSEEYWTQWD